MRRRIPTSLAYCGLGAYFGLKFIISYQDIRRLTTSQEAMKSLEKIVFVKESRECKLSMESGISLFYQKLSFSLVT